MTAVDATTGLPEPPWVSGGEGETGHLEELRTDPIALMQRVRDECGDVGQFRLADKELVLLSDAEANELFFRATDEELDQAAAYPFMTPIFGEGVVFDASPERRREQLHNMALRDKHMRGHAETIQREVDEMVARWGDATTGQIDLLDWFAELTIYTSSSCLIGRKFRLDLDRRFADLYHDLERGTDALAFVDPYADIPSFHARDRARAGLVALVQDIMDRRAAAGPPADDDRDLLDVLMMLRDEEGELRFDADDITGMFISMMFAGHHTTSGTAAWTLIELLRHPEEMAAVVAELDELYAEGTEVSYQALREMPRLEAAIKEALRLHPPLIILMRVVNVPFDVGGYHVPAGKMVAASPAISNRLPEAFDDPDAFRPSRYLEDPAADVANPWNWIPFGAGRHRCVGAAFAMMQLKAIFSVLLKDWSFAPAQPPESYRNDHSKMVVQLAQPCLATFTRRSAEGSTDGLAGGTTVAGDGAADGTVLEGDGRSGTAEAATTRDAGAAAGCPVTGHGVAEGTGGGGDAVPSTRASGWRIEVDEVLCQGHAVCESEAPDVFAVGKATTVRLLDRRPPEERRGAVEAAVRYCPTHALRIVEDDA